MKNVAPEWELQCNVIGIGVAFLRCYSHWIISNFEFLCMYDNIAGYKGCQLNGHFIVK